MKTLTDTTLRQALLSILLTALILMSGCAGLLSGEGGSNGAGTPTATPAQENSTSRTDGTDLRSASIPETGSVTVSGELDRGDPKSGGKYYEPIQVTAAGGDTVNISMETENESPKLRVIGPDGNVTAIVSNEGGTATGFNVSTFPETGRYTLEATSVNQNATFNYTLTIERSDRSQLEQNDELFAGDASEWNETEKYLRYSEQFAEAAQGTTPVEAQFPANATGDALRANATGDYLVLTYQLDSDYNFTLKNGIDVTLALTYTNLRETYTEFGNDSNTRADVSWVPEIIFFRGVDNETGELVRTTFLTEEWAQAYGKHEDFSLYGGWYYSTIRQGPGSPVYNPEDGITDAEFPQAYYSYTYPADNSTLAERYGL